LRESVLGENAFLLVRKGTKVIDGGRKTCSCRVGKAKEARRGKDGERRDVAPERSGRSRACERLRSALLVLEREEQTVWRGMRRVVLRVCDRHRA
jgi:hypothetical protein